jgi:GT2 family glycosyltransferase
VETIVIDDGSTDSTSVVSQSYPIRYIYQDNQGLPAARNAGILASRGEFIVLLDSDDRLFPHAIESGLRMFELNPECMMATGDFSFVSASGTWMRPSGKPVVTSNHYEALLRSNFIEMTASCLFRKEVFERVGLFDSSLRASEDYEFYLRVALKCKIVCHPTMIAEYRSHGSSMSKDGERMLNETMRVVKSQMEHVAHDPARREAHAEGQRFWRRLYGRHLAAQLALQPTTRKEGYGRRLKLLAREYPQGFLILLFRRLMSKRVNAWILEREHRRAGWIPAGKVQLGDLRRLVPIGRLFDFDRGKPIHNFYCEKFLGTFRSDICGSVLHIGEAESRGRAGDSVSAVLRSLPLERYQSLSLDDFRDKEWDWERFDCILISDSLEYAPNIDVVLAAVKRLLRPGGVILAILPGLQNGHRQRGIKNLHWHFTTHSASAIFERYFGRENIQVIGSGNILAAVAALHGLVVEELDVRDIDAHDPAYEVSIFVRAVNVGSNGMVTST